MKEIFITLAVLLTTNICYAADGGMSGPELLYNFKLLIGIGIFGVIGSALLSMLGNGKVGGMIMKVSFFGAFIVFLNIAASMLDSFLNIYRKIEKLIG